MKYLLLVILSIPNAFGFEIIVKKENIGNIEVKDSIKELGYYLIDSSVNIENLEGLKNHKFQISFKVRDPLLKKQIGFKKVRGHKAQKLSLGSSNIVVAVADTGLDLDHLEFRERVWKNTKEIPEDGIDNDNNGYIDDVQGWDFGKDSADIMDENGHGTHIAGIIGANSENNFGVVGLNQKSPIMVLKVMDKEGKGSLFSAAKSIVYATNMGAKVINASWGIPFYSKVLHDAVLYAQKRNVLIVAAAGNSSINNDISSIYPANFEENNIISVGSSNKWDFLSSFSNYGSRVHLSAPGEEIFSTYLDGSFKEISGTSMSTGFVTGVVSLMASVDESLSCGQIKNGLMGSTARKLNLGKRIFSQGRLNAYKALSILNAKFQVWPRKFNIPREKEFKMETYKANGVVQWEVVLGKRLASIDSTGLLRTNNKKGLFKVRAKDSAGNVSYTQLITIY